MAGATHRSFRIHGPNGVIEHAVQAVARTKKVRAVADATPVTDIMTTDVVCADPRLDLRALIELMVREHLGCVPVVDDNGHPIGMVTKLDIVEHVAVPSANVAPKVADVMMPLAITLGPEATVAHTSALMAMEEMHHVMIVDGGQLIGVVSTMDVTRWLAEHARTRV